MNQGQILCEMFRLRNEVVAKFPEHAAMLNKLELKVSGRMTRRLGHCKFIRMRWEEISTPFLIEVSWAAFKHDANRSELPDTILHELAHAIAGRKASHGPQWKAWARKLGARPEACCDKLPVSPIKPRKLVEIACNSCRKPLTVTERQATMVRNGTRQYRHKGCRSKMAPTIIFDFDLTNPPRGL